MDLSSINWKRHANTFFKVLTDKKILMMIVLMGFTIYGIGWDTFLRPGLTDLQSRDEAIKLQNDQLAEKKNLQQQYGTWEKELKGLETQLIPLLSGDSAKVMSVTEQSALLKLARGQARDEALLPLLQPPHNERSAVSVTPTGNTVIDLMTGEAFDPAAQQQAGAPVVADGGGSKGGSDAKSQILSALPVERYDFDLKVSGTYAALTDVLNELVLRKSLVRINKVVITKPPDEEEPDVREYPDYPVKLDMVVSLSVFLYESVQPDPGP